MAFSPIVPQFAKLEKKLVSQSVMWVINQRRMEFTMDILEQTLAWSEKPEGRTRPESSS